MWLVGWSVGGCIACGEGSVLFLFSISLFICIYQSRVSISTVGLRVVLSPVRLSHTPSCSAGSHNTQERVFSFPFLFVSLGLLVSLWFSDSILHVSMSPSRCVSSRSLGGFSPPLSISSGLVLNVSVFFLMSRSFSSEPPWLLTTCIFACFILARSVSLV